jgi:hypothetical protein
MLGILRKMAVPRYYVIRPLLPRRIQLALRRVLARRQRLPTFPAWPLEPSLHDLYAWLFETVTAVAGCPVPWLDPWAGRQTVGPSSSPTTSRPMWGARDMALLRDVERLHGYRSFVELRAGAI